MSLTQVLMDPDEGRFLQALWNPKTTKPAFEQYAVFLHARDPLRSEFLAIIARLSGPDILDNPLQDRARYAELLVLLDAFGSWLRFVPRNERLLNCGSSANAPPFVRFQFRCPKQWEGLAPTERVGVRYCEECRREVHYCDNVVQAEDRARRGDCIAVPRHVTNEATDDQLGLVTGQPDLPRLWAEKLFG